jgi:hypothetical protein
MAFTHSRIEICFFSLFAGLTREPSVPFAAPALSVRWFNRDPVAGHLFWKVLSNFRRNLTISHLINRFNTRDASAEIIFLETFLQFVLRLARAKYQNRFCITNTRNYRIVVYVETLLSKIAFSDQIS